MRTNSPRSVTTHISLIDAIARIEPKLVERVIGRAHKTLVQLGIASPRIGVCGINPHACENGLFGHGEEATKIAPAIAACRARAGVSRGLCRRIRSSSWRRAVMIRSRPIKVLGLEASVNITVGLPVIRTSVDHGTAFDPDKLPEPMGAPFRSFPARNNHSASASRSLLPLAGTEGCRGIMLGRPAPCRWGDRRSFL